MIETIVSFTFFYVFICFQSTINLLSFNLLQYNNYINVQLNYQLLGQFISAKSCQLPINIANLFLANICSFISVMMLMNE